MQRGGFHAKDTQHCCLSSKENDPADVTWNCFDTCPARMQHSGHKDARKLHDEADHTVLANNKLEHSGTKISCPRDTYPRRTVPLAS